MARLKMLRDYRMPIGDTGKTRTWPFGWEGEVDDDVATKMLEEGAGELLSDAPKPKAPDVEIPEGWQDLPADDVVALAHKLGAAGDVNTKAKAVEFIGPLATKLV